MAFYIQTTVVYYVVECIRVLAYTNISVITNYYTEIREAET